MVIAGCSGDGGNSGSDKVRAVATTTQVADIVREVGGETVEVTQIMQPNTDPHDYEPRPSDVAAFADAEIVFVSGGHLDEWSEQLIEDSGSNATVVDLSRTCRSGSKAATTTTKTERATRRRATPGKSTRMRVKRATRRGRERPFGRGPLGPEALREGEAGHSDEKHSDDSHSEAGEETDPHWWHDPVNVRAATGEVETALVEAEPAGEADIAANADSFRAEIEVWMGRSPVASIPYPAEERKIVTDHDALEYFADRYDIEIVGTVIPALTSEAQPSAGDLAELGAVIEREDVKAVFPESAYSPNLAEAVAADTGASTEYSLYGDTLGPDGSEAETWIGMMEENANDGIGSRVRSAISADRRGERGCRESGDTGPAEALVTARGLSLGYGGTPVLTGVEFEVVPGDSNRFAGSQRGRQDDALSCPHRRS